jgi:glucokinase
MAAFTAKGRFSEYTASIAVSVILDDKAAVTGAAYAARSLLKLGRFDLG